MATNSQEWPETSKQHRWHNEAEALYKFEMMLREIGFSDFVYDKEEDLFRFRDGRLAFSREQLRVELLWERDHRA